MHCARLDHFVRFNSNGTIGRCGHMISSPQFTTLAEMEESIWLNSIKESMLNNQWPNECRRCMQTEKVNGTSIRLDSNKFDNLQKKHDYLTVGGVLDNVCNSACLTCDENHSTLIGGLQSKIYPIVDNSSAFWKLPLDRIVHLDISGGEPSASKNYKHILANLPKNIKSIRLNTNCSAVLDELWDLCRRGVHVTVTVSLDGIGKIHDYVRWPIKWEKFHSNLQQYMSMPVKLNTWTTVSALNIGDFNNIIKFVKENNIDHSWALLDAPHELNIRYSNRLTVAAKDVMPEQVAIDKNNDCELELYISKQDSMRNIKIKDYYDQL